MTYIDLTYLLIGVESTMIWRTGKAALTSRSISQTSMDIEDDNIGSPEKSSLPNGNGSAKVKPFEFMIINT